MSSTIVHPDYIRLIERVDRGWLFKRGKLFYKRLPIASADMDDFEFMYGISKQQIAIELFRLKGGKAGYYLANLRDRQYYYCGLEPEDVKTMLLRLGIGRA
jgi:hypothetical protein